ncbi:23S rRNA (guanosine(2251)-2'-O)-methyltransferase RlmB [Campylobacter upsaliensis]|nr:23S rRNA (guanosine(2251)-2'-O)-methyltransferase RlmB [Campylobacter upsaliensis]ECQ8105050.1 23S rRNA (guanosine(2251)-2'-O)-methyltransferase RlmB [Campylobacter upsaliensis]EGK8112535.1 23S rRNA (guanosine(2251)-2'-O)-methyltransferase RlmB [Campylobacter upsaliensis]
MIVYGKQVFFYILQKHKEMINELYLAKECDKVTFSLIAKAGFKIKKLDFKSAQALARGGNHQGFLMDIKEFDFVPFCELKKSEFIVMLCGISDVGNIGAIIRTAYALGVDGLLFIGKNLAQESIVRSSSGAALDLPICLSNDALSALNELKQMEFKLYGADGKGREVHHLTFPKGKKVLIMGSEGFGLSSKIIQKCDECVGIAMQNDFDSLNVSAAFAILCDRIVHAKL